LNDKPEQERTQGMACRRSRAAIEADAGEPQNECREQRADADQQPFDAKCREIEKRTLMHDHRNDDDQQRIDRAYETRTDRCPLALHSCIHSA
jgi:hypothetical protein